MDWEYYRIKVNCRRKKHYKETSMICWGRICWRFVGWVGLEFDLCRNRWTWNCKIDNNVSSPSLESLADLYVCILLWSHITTDVAILGVFGIKQSYNIQLNGQSWLCWGYGLLCCTNERSIVFRIYNVFTTYLNVFTMYLQLI